MHLWLLLFDKKSVLSQNWSIGGENHLHWPILFSRCFQVWPAIFAEDQIVKARKSGLGTAKLMVHEIIGGYSRRNQLICRSKNYFTCHFIVLWFWQVKLKIYFRLRTACTHGYYLNKNSRGIGAMDTLHCNMVIGVPSTYSQWSRNTNKAVHNLRPVDIHSSHIFNGGPKLKIQQCHNLI